MVLDIEKNITSLKIPKINPVHCSKPKLYSTIRLTSPPPSPNQKKGKFLDPRLIKLHTNCTNILETCPYLCLFTLKPIVVVIDPHN